MLAALREVLTDPESFFEAEADDPGLLGPAAVVVAVAVVGLLAALPVLRATLGAVPAGAGAFVAVGLAFGAVVALVTPFVVWLVYAGLFTLLSIPLDGDGEFRAVFALVGWGFAPRVLSGAVDGLLTFLWVQDVDFSDPEAVQGAGQALATEPLGIASQAFGILMTLWAAWIWTHAVAASRDLSVRRAAVPVGVVVGAGVLFGLASTYLL